MGPNQSKDATLLTIEVDPESEVPLQRQIYDRLRSGILDGTLPGSTRLPSTRALATNLGVARNTVLYAYEQLLAEGYLNARVGRGTHVADGLAKPSLTRSRQPAAVAPRISHRARAIAGRAITRPSWLEVRPFQPGVPALDAFPLRAWSRIAARVRRESGTALLGYGDPRGWLPLREAIADYLRVARGVCCEASQVAVVGGSQQALDLIARVLLDPGDSLWIEEPGYSGAHTAFLGAGARLVTVPVDADGIDVSRAPQSDPRLVFVTPSHQFPLGVTMSITRRLALLEAAKRHGAWVVEDDYDSEFRYRGSPLPTLHDIDTDGRVIYVGTFSKTLAPGLRIGFIVLPPALVDPFVEMRNASDQHSTRFDQAVLAIFMREGHFGRHLRRMRKLYGQRREILSQGLVGVLGENAGFRRDGGAGLHLTLDLDPRVDDVALAHRLDEDGIQAPPLTAFYLGEPVRRGLVLGFAGFDEAAIAAGIDRLAPRIQAL